MSKKILTKEEKQQKKFENKYKIFRNKIMAIIAFVLFVGCAVMAAIGTLPKNATNDILVLMGSIGTIVAIILPFFIFRKPALAIMLVGTGFFDAGVIFNNTNGAVSSGVMFFIFGLICFMIGEKVKDKRKGNHAIKLEDDFVKDLIFNDPNYEVGTTLTYGSQIESAYKARLHFTAAIISVLTCGIGLLLPFGAKALKYGKGTALITSESELLEDKNHNPEKPYKNLRDDGEFYIEGKRLKIKSPYLTIANIGFLLSFGYCLIMEMRSAIFKRPGIILEDETTAGTIVFSTKLVADENPEAVQILVAYSKHQSDENREAFMEALRDLSDSIDESLKREGDRIARYEEERNRFASVGATGTSVKTDGKDFYVEGTYDGVEGVKKLDTYDRTTGVGEYTDEQGKKVKVKNTNKK